MCTPLCNRSIKQNNFGNPCTWRIPPNVIFLHRSKCIHGDDTENRARLYDHPSPPLKSLPPPFHFKTFTNYALAFQWKWIPRAPLHQLLFYPPPSSPLVSSFEFNAFGPTWNSLDFTSKCRAIFSTRPSLSLFVTGTKGGREGEIDSQIGGMVYVLVWRDLERWFKAFSWTKMEREGGGLSLKKKLILFFRRD